MRNFGCTEDDAAAVRQLFEALDADDLLVGSFRRALAEAESASRSGDQDYLALFRIRLQELQAGRDEPKPIPIRQIEIDLEEWSRQRFELPDIANREPRRRRRVKRRVTLRNRPPGEWNRVCSSAGR